MDQLKLLNHTLLWRNREQWEKAVQLLELFFDNNGAVFAAAKEKASLLKDTINSIDAFIQRHTDEVCPHCQNVCCINRHGYYDYEDLIYVYALGMKPPAYKEGIEDTSSCQFISRNGCTIERALRPFRCNWYFCSELIRHMEEGPPKPYRDFIRQFQRATGAKKTMLDEFFAAAQGNN